MALEEPSETDLFVNKESLQFAIESGLVKLMSMMGNINIDYKDSKWFGGGFNIHFESSNSSCC
jgi:hypothetical protein